MFRNGLTTEPQIEEKIELSAPVVGGMRWFSTGRILRDRSSNGVLPRRNFEAEVAAEEKKIAEEKNRRAMAARPEPAVGLGPHFTAAPPVEARVGEKYEYRATAYDAMVTAFTWFLEKAPPGMVVDRHTGVVAWTPREGGGVEVVLGVRTLHGRIALQSWSICVRKAVVARRSIPNPRYREALRRKSVLLKSVSPPMRAVWRKPGQRIESANAAIVAATATTRQTNAPPGRCARIALPLRR